MKIQNLAVIFIIIILPISVILSEYTRSQIQTLSLQISYDDKLNNATYDALKTFQLNTINSATSDLANSKLSDIEASVSIFFRSIASNFNMAGYNQEVLREYVPALVYTMYDGYYIYSPYTNTLDNTNKIDVVIDDGNGNSHIEQKSDKDILHAGSTDATYKEGDRLSGLKPYIPYSCRYQKGDDDFIITYSLDNYITIQGMIGGDWVYKYGYLIDENNIQGTGDNIKYRNEEIYSDETLEELVYNPDNDKIEKYKYIKINGVKYYKDTDADGNEVWFSILGEKRYNQPDNFSEKNKAAIYYYNEAKEFTEFVKRNLSKITGADAVDEITGQTLYEKDEDGKPTSNYLLGNYPIFKLNENGVSIEDPESNFNQQRLAVIRYTIEKNLSIAINNYNNYTSGTTNFQMPKLKEDEWDKIINNVSIISFLQGLNMGGKVYNGYSIITNNLNREVVSEDSIYIVTNDNQYHRTNDLELQGSTDIKGGFLNLDFEIKSVETDRVTGKVTYIPQRKY